MLIIVGAVSAGLCNKLQNEKLDCNESSGSESVLEFPTLETPVLTSCSVTLPDEDLSQQTKRNKNMGSKSRLPETDETKNLSTAELQRLVLLEQLQVFRLMKERLTNKAAASDQINRQQVETDELTGNLYFNLM